MLEQIKEQITRVSFVKRLKHFDEETWNDFYQDYGPIIIRFAMKRGCNREMADDVLQETVVALMKQFPRFDYQRQRGKFRSLLFKISESKIIDAFRKQQKQFNHQNPEQLIADRDLQPEQLWDQSWKSNLLALACSQVRKRVKPLTFLCFEKVFLNGMSVKNTAEELNISPNLVSQHKHKVLTMIVETAEELKQD